MINRISFLQDMLSSVFNREAVEGVDNDTRSFEELCDALLSERGEVSGNRIANLILTRFNDAESEDQLAFFRMLVERFDIDTEEVRSASESLSADNTASNLAHLLNCAEPKRQELFRRLNRIPGATGMLVNMRKCLLVHMREHSELARIDIDFQRLFRAWFNRGFLALREIDWQTPANILEKLIEYEAVHAMSSWDSLRRRLAPADRKCFAFFHPSMLDEPLIFVEVALTKAAPQSIKEILTENRNAIHAESANTAVFYSISNCQAGLAGVSFGNFLIKQVAQELSLQLPELTTFRTLSPVPGFMRWVDAASDTDDDVLRGRLSIVKRIAVGEIEQPNDDEQKVLSQMAARYLVEERRSDNQPLDPVARFHLGNGARLDHILPVADLYKKGLGQSAGVMVSYLYDLDEVIANHEGYATDRIVFTSDEVQLLLKKEKKKKTAAKKKTTANNKKNSRRAS